VRQAVFRAAGSALPGLLESRARFGAIDMTRTRAFSDELNYFPSIHFNVRGREPHGTVHPSDVGVLRREVELALSRLRDPWTGAPIVRRVWAREELYDGPFVERAPDLLLDLHLDRHLDQPARGGAYSYNLQPSASAPPGTGVFRKLAPAEYLGRKGRTLPGSHRSHGLFVAAGPAVTATGEIDAKIADVTATLLARMNVAVPPEASGRILWEVLDDGDGAPAVLPSAAPTRARGAGDEAAVEARLRALGYVDS
jgi:hypothetical protein